MALILILKSKRGFCGSLSCCFGIN